MGSSSAVKKASVNKPPGKISATSIIITEGSTQKQLACISLDDNEDSSKANKDQSPPIPCLTTDDVPVMRKTTEKHGGVCDLREVDLDVVPFKMLKPLPAPNTSCPLQEFQQNIQKDCVQAFESYILDSEEDLNRLADFGNFPSSEDSDEDDEELRVLRELLDLSIHESYSRKRKGILKNSSSLISATINGPKEYKKISFNSKVMVSETFSEEDYQRKGEFVAQILTPEVALLIKNELNAFKKDMDVHEESRQNTQFYQI